MYILSGTLYHSIYIIYSRLTVIGELFDLEEVQPVFVEVENFAFSVKFGTEIHSEDNLGIFFGDSIYGYSVWFVVETVLAYFNFQLIFHLRNCKKLYMNIQFI